VLKTVASGLGIAAGALVIASNPVGWALGVAAAATLGGLAAYKIYTKWKKTRRKKQAKERVRNEMEMPQREEIPEVDENDQNQGGEQGQDEAGMEQADPSQLDEQRRKQGVELGNRIAQQVSKSGKVAGEIRAAVPGHKDRYYKYLDEDLKLGHWTHAELRGTYAKGYPYPQHVLKAHDALVILSVLNLTPEEVESESGQELIEKKLSATDSL
jgi:hypothetical protein